MFVASWLALVVATTSPPCDGTVQGVVLDESTAEAIPRATVTVEPASAPSATATTDDEGAFTLRGVCPGKVRLTVSRADYDEKRRIIAVDGATTTVDVSLRPREVDVLDDVVVTAPGRERLDTAPSETISGAALDDVRGRSLADALAGVSGVTVLRSPAGGMGKPIIRGQVGRRNLILYDGVRHEGQKWGIDHAPELDPFAADSLTVVKGAGGIRYGPDAIGGVVLIDPPPLPTKPGLSGETHFIGVSNGLRGITATRMQGTHARVPGLAWRVEGNASRGAALVTPDYPLDNTGSRIWNAAATLGYARRGFSVAATWRHHAMQAGIFTGMRNDTLTEFEDGLGLDRPVGSDLYRRDYGIERPLQSVSHDIGLLRGRAPLGTFGELVATYAVQMNRRDEYDTVRQSVTGPQVEFDLVTHSADVVVEQAPAPLGAVADLEGSFGAGYVFRSNRYDGNDPAFLPDYLDHQGGVFALERVVFERVELEAGARYDGLARTSYLDRAAFGPARAQERLPEDCSATDVGGRCGTPFHAGSGSLGLLVRPVRTAREFVVKLDGSTAVRFPSTDEQFIKGSAPSFPVFANGDGRLGPERTWGGSLTVRHATDWLFVEGSGYANYIDDYIYFRAEPQSSDPADPNFSECAPLTCGVQGAFPLFAPSPVDALFFGGEVSGEVRPPKWPVSFEPQGAWVRARQIPGGAPLVFIPPDHYALTITYHWPDLGRTRNGHLGVTGTFVDRQRRYDPDADFATPPPGYGLLGAEAGLEVPFSGQVLAVSVVGRNLTNARYRDYTSLLRYFANEPGWELALRLSLRFAFEARTADTP